MNKISLLCMFFPYFVTMCVLFFSTQLLAQEGISVQPVMDYGDHPNPQAAVAEQNQRSQANFDACMANQDEHFRECTLKTQSAGGPHELNPYFINGVPRYTNVTSDQFWVNFQGKTREAKTVNLFIPVIARCPAGTQNITTFQGEDRTVTCLLPATSGQCNGLEGNPIKPASQEKYEFAEDYASHDGFLTVQRQYVNQVFGWNLDEQAVLIAGEGEGSCLLSSPVYYTRYVSGVGFEQYSSTYCHTGPASSSNVHIKIDGQLYRFTQRDDGRYEPEGRLSARASLIALPSDNETTQQSDSDEGPTSENVDMWELTDSSNNRLYFSSKGLLNRKEYATGGRLVYTYINDKLSTKTDHFGRTVTYSYDDSDRLESILLPDGESITYAYVHEDDLALTEGFHLLKSVSWSNGEYIEYLYNESGLSHGTSGKALTGKIDALGQRIGTYRYNSNKATSTEGALGTNKREITGYYPRTITDSLGNRNFIYYDQTLSDGTLLETRKSQPAGSGCNASSRDIAYDDKGFKISEHDFNGNKSLYANDPERGLRTVSVEGISQSDTTDYLIANATLPNGVYKTTQQWHADWRNVVARYSPNKIKHYYFHGDSNPSTPGEFYRCAPLSNSAPLLCHSIEYASLDHNGSQGASAIADTRTEAQHTFYTYNADGQMLTESGEADATIDVVYEYYTQTTSAYTKGDLKSKTNALGHEIRYTQYDKNGRVLEMVDVNGVVTHYTYDIRGRLTSQTFAGITIKYIYDLIGNVVEIQLPDGQVIHYEYDAARRLIATSNANNNRIEYEWDTENNLLAERIVRGSDSEIMFLREQAYDALHRLEFSIDGNGNEHNYLYDANGNLRSTVNPREFADAAEFDPLDRLSQMTDANEGLTQFAYDGHDRLTQVTDANGNTTEYFYDVFGNLLEQSSPDTGTTTYTYDTDNNRTSQTDARGIVVNYSYDALNRLTSVDYPSSTSENIEYSYDNTTNNYGVGRLTKITDESGTTTYRYDHRGNVISKERTQNGLVDTSSYTYDAANNMTSTTYPSGLLLTYTYDALSRTQSISAQSASESAQVLVENIQYLPFGPISQFTLGNGIVRTVTHDNDYRLNDIIDTGISTVLGLNYTYDANGNITELSNTLNISKNQVFAYDPLDRLNDATGAYGDIDYQYDPVSNRTQRTQTQNGSVSDELYNYFLGSNQLSSISQSEDGSNSTRIFDLDENGNTVQDETTRTIDYTYNAANRPSQAIIDGARVSYVYNALGQRVSKTIDDKPTYFIYDEAGKLIAETRRDASNQITYQRDYIYLYDQLVSTVVTENAAANDSHANADATTNIYYYHTDHLNTPRLLTDTNQSTVWQGDYQPFGDVKISTELVENNIRFPGQYYDQETWTNYNYFRTYDSSLGRYLQSDPIGLRGGLNTYGYALQNPLYWIDPLGLAVTCTYSQSTGQLTCTDDTTNQQTVNEQCYSGAPGAVNDGSQQNTPNVGPIPLGDYDIGAGVGNRGTGPNSLPLTPTANNNQFPSTRDPNSFLMHGDNSQGNQSASQGCIICSPNTRNTINNSGGGTVTVQ